MRINWYLKWQRDDQTGPSDDHFETEGIPPTVGQDLYFHDYRGRGAPVHKFKVTSVVHQLYATMMDIDTFPRGKARGGADRFEEIADYADKDGHSVINRLEPGRVELNRQECEVVCEFERQTNPS